MIKHMTWTESVIDKIYKQLAITDSLEFSRKELIAHHLDIIIAEVGSGGKTPEQTLTRELIELQEAGLIERIGRGKYRLIQDTDNSGASVSIQKQEPLLVNRVQRTALFRTNQSALRSLCLDNYEHRCALCQVSENDLQVTSHIVPVSHTLSFAGDLRNVICLCVWHDKLFENGYLKIQENYQIMARPGIRDELKREISQLKIRLPNTAFRPDPNYLKIRNSLPASNW